MGLPLCKTTSIWEGSKVARIQSLLSHNRKNNYALSALTAEKYTAYPAETCFPYSVKVLMARNTKPLSIWHRKHSRQHHTWWCIRPTAPQASWVLKNLKKYKLYFCFTVRRGQKRQNCMGLSRFEHWLPAPACPCLAGLHIDFLQNTNRWVKQLDTTQSLLPLSLPKKQGTGVCIYYILGTLRKNKPLMALEKYILNICSEELQAVHVATRR